MILIERVKAICDRLAPEGWRDLLLRASGGHLDIRQPTASSLRAELSKPLTGVRRDHPGFEDFSLAGDRGITAGVPARSLLFHALASPGVHTRVDGTPLRVFPTRGELEAVENLVFGIAPPTIAELLQRTGASKLAIVVFAGEYRPAKDTCARVEADMAYSRTGIARVGTAPPRYDGSRRGYWPEVDEDPHAVRVCPAHYAAYLAVEVQGSASAGLPMRFRAGDGARSFWVPVHKLFPGTECLAGFDLAMRLTARHVNEKILRIHRALGTTPSPTGFPYRITTGIAEFSTDASDGLGCLVPVVHGALVEPAAIGGKLVTFRVPPNDGGFAALELPLAGASGAPRNGPAYVHSRTRVDGDVVTDLNEDAAHPDVLDVVRRGGYDALHYVDYTGEGVIDVECPTLAGAAGISGAPHAAFSLVAAPDFFPDAGQRELSEWTESGEVPGPLAEAIWGVPPEPLCDVRLPANIQVHKGAFDPKETTVSAVVPLRGATPPGGAEPTSRDARRHSCLPDDAAGVFAPGWDVSQDVASVGGATVRHLAAYGLGSPFPEDAKLCAALSSFWPAVAPDVFRGLAADTGNSSLLATVVPMTDEESGQSGSLPWDGIAGPGVVTIGGQEFADCVSFLHADYVRQALRNRFSIRQTARIDLDEYARRVLAMAVAYVALGPDTSMSGSLPLQKIRTEWFVLGFTVASAGSEEAQEAQAMTGVVLSPTIYRCDLFRRPAPGEIKPKPGDHRRRLMPIRSRRTLLVDVDGGHRIVLRRLAGQSTWRDITPPDA